MSFIVKKKINGKEYYYLNESKRINGKVVSKYLAYLGKDKDEAEKKAQKILKERGEGKEMKTKEVIPEEKNLVKRQISIDELAAFCKRKGFVYQSGEIYGGLAGFYDYGSLGQALKKNFENVWRRYFLDLNSNFYEIEASEIMPSNVFVASGHLKNFSDIAAKCKKGHIERVDTLIERCIHKKLDGLSVEEWTNLVKENKALCSTCKSMIEYIGPINMMFSIQLGIGTTTTAYLRPETAQSPYVNFKTEFEVARNRLPLGLALIGRAYRNELSPRNLLLRQRAFTQAELQIFFNPAKIGEHEDFESVKDYKLIVIQSTNRDAGIIKVSCNELATRIPKFYVYYMAKVQQFYLDILKFEESKFRFYELNDKEKAFYNKYHFDMEVNLPVVGWTELGGVHYRTDHDLKGHQEISKQNLSVMDEETKERFIPHVLELSFGVDRNFQAILSYAYNYSRERDNIVLSLNPKLAPIKASIFPIVKVDENLVKISRNIFNDLKRDFSVIYDDGGSIGRRYSRADEMGVPMCITVDEETLKDDSATIRDRDSTQQVRVKISRLGEVVRKVVSGESVLNLGKIVKTRVKES
ncbi:MAG TPA: glycine--tRNA ligase [Candidatus Nanoarchaeia archaeon]|nr:glycine--tRNA ligase [Candidatus Nanoarchaeia archaeon]